MKKGPLFWGSFLVSLGSSILLFRNGLVHLPWNFFEDYWSVFLILWGIALLFRGTSFRWVSVIGTGLILGFGLAAVGTETWSESSDGHHWRIHWHDSDLGSSNEVDDECESDSDSTKSVAKQQPPSSDSTQQKVNNDSVHTRTPIY